MKQREVGGLTSRRVADEEVLGRDEDDEEAVAGGEPGDVNAAKSRHELGLVGGDEPCPVGQGVEGIVVDEGEGGLVRVVSEEEVAGGGGAAPGAADGAAAEEGLGGQADEDLPDGDFFRDAAVERRSYCHCGLRHELVVVTAAAGEEGRSSSCFFFYRFPLAEMTLMLLGWAYPPLILSELSNGMGLIQSLKMKNTAGSPSKKN
jgi:hypothetical protein